MYFGAFVSIAPHLILGTSILYNVRKLAPSKSWFLAVVSKIVERIITELREL